MTDDGQVKSLSGGYQALISGNGHSSGQNGDGQS